MTRREQLRRKRQELGIELQKAIDALPPADRREMMIAKLVRVRLVIDEALALLTPIQRELMLRELLDEDLRR